MAVGACIKQWVEDIERDRLLSHEVDVPMEVEAVDINLGSGLAASSDQVLAPRGRQQYRNGPAISYKPIQTLSS